MYEKKRPPDRFGPRRRYQFRKERPAMGIIRNPSQPLPLHPMRYLITVVVSLCWLLAPAQSSSSILQSRPSSSLLVDPRLSAALFPQPAGDSNAPGRKFRRASRQPLSYGSRYPDPASGEPPGIRSCGRIYRTGADRAFRIRAGDLYPTSQRVYDGVWPSESFYRPRWRLMLRSSNTGCNPGPSI